jgi:site-specific recombinase XerD
MARKMSEERQQIMEQESVKYWIETISAPRTRKNYLEQLPKFVAFVGKSPDEIIKERRKQIASADPKIRRYYEHQTIAFQNKLAEQGLAPYSVRSYIRTIMSFFARNDIPLNFHRKELKAAHPKKNQKHIVSNEDIRAMYSFADVRDRALLLTLYHTGMSETDVCKLNIEDADFCKGEAPLYFEKYREKSEMLTGTCFSEDCLYDIRLMLQERGNPEKGALFITQKNRRFETRFIREALQRLAKKAQIQNFQPKDLRDAYHDALQRANINAQVIDRMMGHSLGGARDSYKISSYTIVEAYQKAFPYLTVNHNRREREDTVALKQQISQLQSVMQTTLQQLQETRDEKNHEISSLNERIDTMQQFLNAFASIMQKHGIDIKKELTEQSA